MAPKWPNFSRLSCSTCILSDSTSRQYQSCRFDFVFIPESAQVVVHDEAPVLPTHNDSGTTTTDPSLICTHGSCGQHYLDEPAASCAASTSHRTWPFPQIPTALHYTPCSSSIRIAITYPIPPTFFACAYPSLGIEFPSRASYLWFHVPNFRIAPNQHAQHSTAPTFAPILKVYITINTLLSIFRYADNTTL